MKYNFYSQVKLHTLKISYKIQLLLNNFFHSQMLKQDKIVIKIHDYQLFSKN